MEQDQDIQTLRELIEGEQWDQLPAAYEMFHVQDVARLLEGVHPDVLAQSFLQMPEGRRTDVFSYLSTQVQYTLLQQLDDDMARELLGGLSADDRTALLEGLPQEDAERLLRLLSPEEVKQTLKLLGYPEYSAGRLMNDEYISVRPGWTLARALEHVRAQGKRGETVNTVYVTDWQGRLRGAVSLKRLVLEPPEVRVESLISGPAVSVLAFDGRTEAARMIRHYDLTALPVVDRAQVLLGVVTVDDVMDVLQEETTEDFHKLGGVEALNLSLREARPGLLYRKRVGWLVLLVFVNILAGAGIAYYEETIEAVISLIFFLPLIVAAGGNAGAQASTLMVRALTTGDVLLSDWLWLWAKEFGVSLALGITMGAAVWTIGVWRGGSEVAVVVAIAMTLVVIVGSMIGMLLPFVLARFNVDPAVASTPLITSIADVTGIVIYLTIATALLTLPPAQ